MKHSLLNEIPNNFSSINNFQIGENCILKKVIIDEFVHIGNNVKLINKKNLSFYDSKNIFIRDNISLNGIFLGAN